MTPISAAPVPYCCQVVVALARCRVTKLRVLLTGRSRWLRRLPASQLFSPPEHIPKEALTYLRRWVAVCTGLLGSVP